MKKLILLLALSLGTGLLVAQESRLSLGLEAAMPIGDFGDFRSFGIGGTLGFELGVGNNIGIIGQGGFISFSGKSFGGHKLPSLMAIPVQVGAKYYFIDNKAGPYLGVLGGVHLTSCDGCEAATWISVAPLVGFLVDRFDIGLRYQFMFYETTVVGQGNAVLTERVAHNYIGLRAAYGF